MISFERIGHSTRLNRHLQADDQAVSIQVPVTHVLAAMPIFFGSWSELTRDPGWQLLLVAGAGALVALLPLARFSRRQRFARRRLAAWDAYALREITRGRRGIL